MTLLALGINHKTAPVSLRERVTFSPESIDEALTSLLQQPLVQGGVVLSTCNRTELYLSVEQQEHMHEQLVARLCAYHNLRPEEVKKSLYWHQGNDAVSHLMRGQRVGLIGAGRTADPRAGEKLSPSRNAASRCPASWSVCSRNPSPLPSACVPKPTSAPARSPWLLPPVPGAPDLRIVGRSQRLAGGRR